MIYVNNVVLYKNMTEQRENGLNTTHFESVEILRKEKEMDADNAKREAFGEFDKKILEQLEYENFKNAMIAIRRMGEKMMANTKFSELLREGVSRDLDIDIESVKIFKTTGTVMDKYHKISAWIEFPNVYGRLVYITLDIFTENENKRNNADIVFRKPEKGFNDSNNDQFIATLEEVVSMVTRKAKEKGFGKVSKREDVGYQRAVINPKNSRVVKFGKDK